MGEYNLDKEKLNKLDEFINSLEEQEGELINVLREAQELFGYLSQDLQLYVSRKLDIPASKVFGVATFYSFFTLQPRGKHIINVCLGTACFVRGADKILEEFKKQLNITEGNSSKDGMFTIESLRCVGACGLAPVVVIDEKVFGRIKVEDVKRIIEEYKAKDVEESEK